MMRLNKALIWLVAVGLASGCCALDDNLVLLLPDSSGRVGRVTVTNRHGTQVLSRARQVTRISPRSAPTQPRQLHPREVELLFGHALAAQPAAPARFILYFHSGSVELTPASRLHLPRIIQTIRARTSVDTSVVGHADTAGSEQYNLRLSRKRAVAVAGLLQKMGAEGRHLEITSHGEGNLLIPTGDNVSEPRNRRVEVTVR
jgi:outer membrane protein OmpA-like peptidoglycan-associated protein